MITYSMDKGLKKILNSIAYNVPKDWDSIILIAGSGMVRVGKSVFAQQIGHYLSTKLETTWGINNIVFSGEELMSKAKTMPPHTVFIYDEARGELDTKKVTEQITKTLMDFFAECGLYNDIIIIVLPDFFDLPKGIAINRSELLLNVYRDRETKKDKDGEDIVAFKRGYFRGYHRQTKKKLYILGKKNFNDYDIVKRDFFGEFPNIFTVNFNEYDTKKRLYLSRDRSKEDKEYKFNIALAILLNHFSALQIEKELKEYGLKISNDTIMSHGRRITKDLTINY